MRIVKKNFSGTPGRKPGASAQQVVERRQFDDAMNRNFRDVNMFTSSYLDALTKIMTFNVRRFAHWVNRRSKKVTSEFGKLLKSRFGSHGGLIPSRHFVWNPPPFFCILGQPMKGRVREWQQKLTSVGFYFLIFSEIFLS